MIRIILTAGLGLLISCKEHSNTLVENQAQASVATPAAIEAKDTFKTGIIMPQVALRADASQSFTLYLPSKYSESTKLPVIIFFDPHGDGGVPINLYSTLAEKHGYILMASNSSKNGMNFEQTNTIANNLVDEAKTRFGVDENKITFCGFSGGAKVALLSGSNNSAISTIIYCGAVTNVNPTNPLTLFGFAGTKDMNYTDVVSFEWGLKNATIPHYLIEWKGKHEFPTADIFNDAFVFLTTGKIENYAKKQVTISPQKVAEEQGNKQDLYQALQSQDLNWWKKKIAELNAKKKADAMNERLLGFVSLACYSISNNLLQQNNIEPLGKILAIYKLADPDNTDCDKFYAQYNEKLKMQLQKN